MCLSLSITKTPKMNTSIARVWVNDIEVGSLPLATYKAVQESVKREKRLYLAFAWEFLCAFFRAFGALFRNVPWVTFALLMAMALFDPASFTGLIADLRTADPESVTKGVRVLLQTSFLITFLCIFMAVLTAGRKFGFKNPFDAALSRRIRSLLEVPTDGELTIMVYEEQNDAAKLSE